VKFVPIPEAGKELVRYRSIAPGPTDEITRNPVGLQLMVKPPAQRYIMGRVGDEGPITKI
jgi:hypothetical protein